MHKISCWMEKQNPEYSSCKMRFCLLQNMEVFIQFLRYNRPLPFTDLPLDLSLSQILDIFKLLTLTYPRYTDSGSQDAVEAVGIELVRRDELRGSDAGEQNEVKLGVAEQILGWLSHEVGRLAKNGNSKWVIVIMIFLFFDDIFYKALTPLRICLSCSVGLVACTLYA